MVSLTTVSGLLNSNLGKAAATSSASVNRLASGNKITKASDDVSGLAIGTALRTQVSGLRSALSNATQASSLLQVADGALRQQVDILQRQKSLSVQASSGQLNDTQRQALNQEFASLTAQLDQLAGGTNFNGVTLLDGSISQANGGLDFGVSASGGENITVRIESTTSASLFADQVIGISSEASAQVASAALDTALASITSVRASVGAAQSQFASATSALASAIETQDGARSEFLDTDIAAESTRFAASQVQEKAAIATIAQTNKLSSGLLRLIE